MTYKTNKQMQFSLVFRVCVFSGSYVWQSFTVVTYSDKEDPIHVILLVRHIANSLPCYLTELDTCPKTLPLLL